MKPELEILQAVNLCRPDGSLNPHACGWSRVPLHRCNVAGHWLRKKRWNYWCVTTDDVLFSATVANLDYAGLGFIYLYDRTTRDFAEYTMMLPFGRGCRQGERVADPASIRHKSLTIDCAPAGGGTAIEVYGANLDGKRLTASVRVASAADRDTLNVVIPWSQSRFQYTAKHVGLPAEGVVTWGDRRYTLRPEDAYATLDFGRGVWPYRCAWNWGAAAGHVHGRVVTLNFGGQWTDGTGFTENGACVDGRLSKISEDLRWEYDLRHPGSEWRIKTMRTDEVDVTFTPEYERVARFNAVVIRSEVHQFFGTYRGTVRHAEAGPVEFADLFGWAEDHRARW